MKLIMAVIHDEDVSEAVSTLNKSGFSVTKLASTGGFLRSGNTTLISGVDDDKVEDCIKIIEETCHRRQASTSFEERNKEGYVLFPLEVTVGGATIFVLDVETFRKV